MPVLHVVTDDDVLADPRFFATARRVLEAGSNDVAVHLRGPRTAGRVFWELARALVPVVAGTGGRLVINDRVDVALATGVRAVHLGQRSLPARSARALLGVEGAVGVSCHSVREAEEARDGDADWIFGGSVYPTPSHPGGASIGLDGLDEIVRTGGRGRPVVAIGGISVERLAAVRARGAHGVAVIGGVWGEPDPAAAVRAYISELTRGRHEGARA